MSDHNKLEELLSIEAHSPVRFHVIVGDDVCTEMSPEMHDPILFTIAYEFAHVRQCEGVVTMVAASKVDA